MLCFYTRRIYMFLGGIFLVIIKVWLMPSGESQRSKP